MADMAQNQNPSDLPELQDEVAAPSMTAPPAAAPRRAYPQLWKFLWGGVFVAVGAMLPFGPRVLDRMLRSAEAIERAVDAVPAARPGTQTLAGTVFLVFALLLIGQMWAAIRERRVALGAVFLMIVPCAWSWIAFVSAARAIAWPAASDFVAWNTFERVAAEFGTGFLLTWLGSTLVEITFIFSLVKVFTSPSPAPASARASAARKR